ncbi:MAG: hypothetical protein JWO05_3502 [Gemmatimonadetes bacterium]|nr:hypothetical protein [Gemmatimonadota bacterium]
MNDHLRDRILRKLETLNDERGYQVLDYVEFIESRYAERAAGNNTFNKFTEAIEDKLRAGKVSASAIAETMSLMNRAANVLNGAVAAGKSVASDLATAAQRASSTLTTPAASPPAQPNGTTPASGSGAGSAPATPGAASPPGSVPDATPNREEKL